MRACVRACVRVCVCVSLSLSLSDVVGSSLSVVGVAVVELLLDFLGRGELKKQQQVIKLGAERHFCQIVIRLHYLVFIYVVKKRQSVQDKEAKQ